MQSWVGKLPDYPHPVASSLSGRMVVELGALTAATAAVAAIVGGFLSSAVFAMTSFGYAIAVYVVWPMAKIFIKFCSGLISGILESDNYVELFSDGRISSKLYEIYAFGGVSSSLKILVPMALVLMGMVFVIRFTLSRRPKNYNKWVRSAFYISCVDELIDYVH